MINSIRFLIILETAVNLKVTMNGMTCKPRRLDVVATEETVTAVRTTGMMIIITEPTAVVTENHIAVIAIVTITKAVVTVKTVTISAAEGMTDEGMTGILSVATTVAVAITMNAETGIEEMTGTWKGPAGKLIYF